MLNNKKTSAFTLIELMVAMSLVATVMAITFTTFYSVSNAWQKGLRMAENLNHGEYVMDQLVHGLKSAFFSNPQTNSGNAFYGFMLEKSGAGADSRATFSWVKTGSSLLGVNDSLRKGVHRIQISIENDEHDSSAIAVRAWRPYGIPDGFDPQGIEPFFISTKVIGIDCRISTNRADDGWEWESSWSNDATNHLPLAMEITLYLTPLQKGEDAVEMKRLVEIPVAPISWMERRRRRR